MYKKILLVLLAIHSCLFGKIVLLEEMSQFEEKVGALNHNSLVLFDKDSLLTQKDALLGHHGEKIFFRLAKDILWNPLVVPQDKYPDGFLAGRMFLQSRRTVVEERSVTLVKELQGKAIPVLAMTTLSPRKLGEIEDKVDFAIKELQNFSFCFQKTFPEITSLQLTKTSKNKFVQFAPGFRSGLLFTSEHSKEEVLEQFLTKRGWFPKKIVIVDDDYGTLRSIEEAVKARGVEFVGLYYTAGIMSAKPVDIAIAERQLHYLAENGIWLSDEEARSICCLPIRD